MKLKGKRAKVTITLHEGPHSVPALVFGSYLALIKSEYRWADGVRGGWSITHIPTGRHITGARTRKEGRLLIERLILLDWSPEAALTNGPATRRIAAEVASA